MTHKRAETIQNYKLAATRRVRLSNHFQKGDGSETTKKRHRSTSHLAEGVLCTFRLLSWRFFFRRSCGPPRGTSMSGPLERDVNRYCF